MANRTKITEARARAFVSAGGREAVLWDSAAPGVPPIYLIRGASRTPTGPPALVMAPSSL